MRSRSLIALAVALVVASRGALADTDRRAAAELFRAAEQAFERGDHIGAALTFEQAFDQAPEAATAFAAATAWFKAGNKPRAADAYERAVRLGDLPEERRAHARARLDELGRELARIEIVAPVGRRATLAYARAKPIPFSVWVEPGAHRALLDGEAPSVGSVALTVAAGDRRSIELPDGGAEPASAPIAREQPPPPPAPARSTPLVPVLGWAALGGAAISAGAALYVRSRAVDSVEEFDTKGDPDARERARSERTISYVLWGVAGALGATGITLLVWPSSDSEQGGTTTRVVVTATRANVITSF